MHDIHSHIPHSFPIPMIDELLDEIMDAMIFCKLHLKSGYHQIRMREDILKTTFRSGTMNAPSTFQAFMNKILNPYLRKYVLVFFDNILVYNQDEENHRKHLKLVMQILRENQLFANTKKCSFGQSQLEYLGHLISEKEVSADLTK